MYNVNYLNPISIRIPKEIRSQLSPFHFLILDYVVNLMKCTHRRSTSGAFYAFPSQQHIANKYGYCRTYVSECISQIVALGLLIKIRRRKVNGRWQTNLYKIGLALAAALKCVKSFVSSVFYHVGKTRHIVNKPSINIRSERKKTLLGLKSPPDTAGILDYIRDLGNKIQFRSKPS